LIEYKTDEVSSSVRLNATISFVSDAPALIAMPALQFEAIGGTLMSLPLQSGSASFRSNAMDNLPFTSAPLAFAFTQWSSVVSSIIAIFPIQTTVCVCMQ
jgi:hypothetical protein